MVVQKTELFLVPLSHQRTKRVTWKSRERIDWMQGVSNDRLWIKKASEQKLILYKIAFDGKLKGK